jgi:AbrB family looped-hinge helix DNA binding protein
MRISERGQITIPHALRERYGLLPDTEVELVERDGVLVLVKDPEIRHKRLRALYGKVETGLSTDDIMRLLRD